MKKIALMMMAAFVACLMVAVDANAKKKMSSYLFVFMICVFLSESVILQKFSFNSSEIRYRIY